MTKILILDDEQAIADLIEVYLKNDDYEVYKFYEPIAALECVEKTQIDLAVLDIMLPEMDGLEVLSRIRETHNFPVLMLTAKDEDIDKISGLTIGADDYMTKPFKPLELMARIKAQLRRYTRYNTGTQREDNTNTMSVGDLVLNKDRHSCELDGTPVELTPTEFDILWILCKNRGNVVNQEKLFHEVWGEKYFTSNNNTVMVHIRHLREKMGDSFDKPKYIKTVWGVGYRIDDN
jgi:two-component system response regulator VanR